MPNGSLYADDLCHGADDVESAFNLSSDAKSILRDASFNLRKLHTNSKQLHDLWIQNGLCEENSLRKIRTVLSMAAKVFDPVGFPFHHLLCELRGLCKEIWERDYIGIRSYWKIYS
ncbi:hypothetical protein CEXT_754791 [Caerostris extrusa]|uniref:Reverse transcriptase n=1 Tax=Caerostris extrusa TaxID=172846 RepID=A0AAV4QCP5_CAEEX|nr:hypothetical protein CEXT_754791 [Caerostris extrusa]